MACRFCERYSGLRTASPISRVSTRLQPSCQMSPVRTPLRRTVHSDFCASAWNAIDGEVAVNHCFAAPYRNFGDKNLVAISHADAHGGNWFDRLHEAFVDGERPTADEIFPQFPA